MFGNTNDYDENSTKYCKNIHTTNSVVQLYQQIREKSRNERKKGRFYEAGCEKNCGVEHGCGR